MFKKHYIAVYALLDSDSKVTAIIPVYATVLGLHICFTDVKAQKIDKSMLLIYNMVLANF